MSGGFDAIADIGLGDILSSAADLGSVVTDLGTEFASSFDITSFEIPSFDVSSLGGFDIAGSFAGSADWFNTFNPGSILDSIPSVSDFSLPSLPGLPSLGSLNVNSLVSSAASSFGIPSSITSTISSTLNSPSLISAGAAALGINPSIALSASKVLSGGSPVSAAASAFGINPAVATSLTAQATSLFATNPTAANAVDAITRLPINTPREVDAYGLNILTAAEDRALTRNVNPAFINSLVDPSTAQSLTYDAAVQSKAALTPLIKDYTDQIAIAEQNIASNNANIAAIEAELRDEFLPDARREELEAVLAANYENNAIQQNTIITNQERLTAAGGSLAADQRVIAATEASRVNNAAAVTSSGQVDQYTAAYDPETGTWSVFNNSTGVTTQTGLTEQQAILAAQDLNISSGVTLNSTPVAVNLGTASLGDLALATDPGTGVGIQARNLVQEARNQQTLRNLNNTKAQSSDWRVRLRLAPNSTYLYNDPTPGILEPLSAKTGTDGVVFPYTPAIDTAYKANYDPYELTHSNYRGYFYKNSYVDAINIRAQFTAQDTTEANYLLAVIHFFRSATKMFYGQDAQRGSPPPMVFLSGLGDYQFNEHPCVISQFNYQLPPDVDYIRAQNALDNSTNFLANRVRSTIPGNPLSFAVNRLLNNALTQGALDTRPSIATNLPIKTPTYVPTKMEMSISLWPIQSRQQVSKQFSVQGFANGNLLRGGFW